MAGMTASIARMIRDGTVTLPECTERLGVTRNQLEERLFLMERQGYISRGNETAFPEFSCGHCCSLCTHNRGEKSPSFFVLTQKGERLARDRDD